MRPDSLRPATERAATKATTKLDSRLSKGEKRYRKRMAEVGAVYDITPVPRSPTDVLGHRGSSPAPVAQAKWVTASVADDAALRGEVSGQRLDHRSYNLGRVDAVCDDAVTTRG